MIKNSTDSFAFLRPGSGTALGIRWGIIGLGKIAHSFATDLVKVRGCKLQAVASRSQEKAIDFAKTYGAATAYDSYGKLVRDPNVDVIYIATPHALHCENTMLCLDHGKAVLCEKPFAMNLTEVEKMVTKAQERNIFLMEALWTRFLPHFGFVKEQLDSGKFGEIRNITASFCFSAEYDPKSRLFKKSLGGGALLDVGIYPILLALALLGEPEEIFAKAELTETGVDGTTTIRFSYANGATANLKCSLTHSEPITARIGCENGVIKMNKPFYKGDSVTTHLNGREMHHDFGYIQKGYNFEISHVNEQLRAGNTESPVMDFGFSKKLMGLLDDVLGKIGLLYN